MLVTGSVNHSMSCCFRTLSRAEGWVNRTLITWFTRERGYEFVDTSKLEVRHFCFCRYVFFLPVGFCSHVDESWERYLLPWSCILYNSKVCEFKEVKEEAREDDLV